MQVNMPVKLAEYILTLSASILVSPCVMPESFLAQYFSIRFHHLDNDEIEPFTFSSFKGITRGHNFRILTQKATLKKMKNLFRLVL